ncbi:MAG: hypothetical protein H0W83_14910, partial [Planctomycetes bacterium]|nr:hypothetical protein [Planctomycetota bacterium]
ADSVYSASEQLTWNGDREVYELPANPPAIDDLHRSRVDCKRPGQAFKARSMVEIADHSDRYNGLAEVAMVGGQDNGPLPGRAPAALKATPIAAMDDAYGSGAPVHSHPMPVAAWNTDPTNFRGSGTSLYPVTPVAASRDDQTDWCPPRR